MTTNETPTHYSTLADLDALQNAYDAVRDAVNQLENVNGIGKELRRDLAIMRSARTMILWEWVDQFKKLLPETRARMPKTGELVEVVETVLSAPGGDPVTPALGIVPLVIENYHREHNNQKPVIAPGDGVAKCV